MPLLLAIEPDSRQAAFVTALARDPLNAELIMTSSTKEALQALDERVPDLILTSLLLSPSDDGALTARLRALDDAGKHVQTLVIPLLAEPSSVPEERSGLLQRLGLRKPKAAATPDGCDPAVFAAQITEYLNRRNISRVFAHLQRSSVADASLASDGKDPLFAHNGEADPSRVAMKRVVKPQPIGPADAAAAVVSDLFKAPSLPTAKPRQARDVQVEPLLVVPESQLSAASARPAAIPLKAVDVPVEPFLVVPESQLSAASPRSAAIPLKAVDVPVEPLLAASEPVSFDDVSRLPEAAADDLPAIDVDLEAMLAAPVAVDELAAEPLVEHKGMPARTPRPEPVAETAPPDFETAFELAESEEPAAPVPSIRPDLLELLAAIRSELEPLRSAPEHRALPAAKRPAETVQDEWGFFDPQQCGMSALLNRLEQISQKDLVEAARD